MKKQFHKEVLKMMFDKNVNSQKSWFAQSKTLTPPQILIGEALMIYVSSGSTRN